MPRLRAIRTYVADVALALAMLICLGGTLSFILLTTLERQREGGSAGLSGEAEQPRHFTGERQ